MRDWILSSRKVELLDVESYQTARNRVWFRGVMTLRMPNTRKVLHKGPIDTWQWHRQIRPVSNSQILADKRNVECRNRKQDVKRESRWIKARRTARHPSAKIQWPNEHSPNSRCQYLVPSPSCLGEKLNDWTATLLMFLERLARDWAGNSEVLDMTSGKSMLEYASFQS